MRFRNLILGVMLLASSCSDRLASPPNDTVKGTGVVREISITTIDGLPDINIWPVKGTPLSASARLALFEDFAPGLTFDGARKRYGEPTTTRTLANKTELHCYRRDGATLAVARELYFSSSPPGECWTVFAFPNEGGFKLGSLVASNVLDQVRSPSPPYYLVLRDSTPLEASFWLRVDSVDQFREPQEADKVELCPTSRIQRPPR